MTEYIEREAISEEIRKYYYKNPSNSSYEEGFDRGLDRAQRAILDAPAADVALMLHGKWIEPSHLYYGAKQYECSLCCSDTFWNKHSITEKYPHCPNCGATMELED